MDARKASTLLEVVKLYNGGRGWRGRCWLCADRAAACGVCAGCARDLPRRTVPELPPPAGGPDRCRAAFDYAFPLDRLVHAAKFSGDLAALETLGRLLASEVTVHFGEFDHVLPVPLPAARYLARGYNQAAEIARVMAKGSGFRIDGAIVRRSRGGPPQSSLPGRARAANVRDAFTVTRDLAGAEVLIVDDVITTGATVTAVARALRRAGAARVEAVAVAATGAVR